MLLSETTNTIRKTDNLGAVDIARFISAVFICMGHSGVSLSVGGVLGIVIRGLQGGVAFFFVASGFFTFFNMQGYYGEDTNLRKLQESLLKMIRRFFFWCGFGLPIVIYTYAVNQTGIVYAIILYIRDLIFRGEHTWGVPPTWYILSTIYTIIILYILLKRGQSEKSALFVIAISLLLRYVICLFPYEGKNLADSNIGQYIFDNTIRVYDARMLEGMSLFPVGMLIAKYGINKRFRVIPWIAIVPAVILSSYVSLSSPIWDLLWGTIYFLVFYMIKLKSDWICRGFRRISSIVYFTHVTFIYIWQRFHDNETGAGAFLFAIAMSVTLGFIIHIMCEKNICRGLTRILL